MVILTQILLYFLLHYLLKTVNGNITLTLPENDGFSFYKNKAKTYKNFSTSFALKDSNQKEYIKMEKYYLILFV